MSLLPVEDARLAEPAASCRGPRVGLDTVGVSADLKMGQAPG